MIYSELVKKACCILFEAHKDDKDKGGYPYVFHPFYLASQMTDEVSVCVALLHDVIEDHGTQYNFAFLEREGFSEEILSALRLLTHNAAVPYMDYVRAIAKNPIAARVKCADLRHNLDTTRTNGIQAPKHSLYLEALAFLESNTVSP